MTVVVVIKFLEMKKIIWTIFAIAALVFSSCSNKVDLYADGDDYTVVYAMLDASLDTNFIKITKSFLGNANELSHNYEANNYKYEDLEVKFTGKFNDSNNTQTISLDTIYKWIPYDENSNFYSGCYQTYYYTDKKLKEGEEYKIEILRKIDNVTISASTTTINSFSYQKPIDQVPITFSDVTTSTTTVEWRVLVAPYKSTASYFEVTGYFNYSELQPGAQDTIHNTIRWSLGSGEADKLYNTSTNMPYYVVTYAPSSLFSLLANDKYLNENSPAGVQRWFDKFEFRISAVGDELYNYYLINNSSSAIQDVPNYTNIDNGVGIMSSRINKSRFLKISERTRNKIAAKFENYGFIVDPNR